MAVGTGTALAIGALAPVVGGAIGAGQAQGSVNDANRARANALAQYMNISVPEAEDMMLNLSQYQSQGQLDPALEQIMSLGDTALAGVSTDPRLRSEQMSALDSYSNLAKTGMSAADQAGFELARQNAAGEMQAKNNQVLQEMQQRGQGGSGAELIARLNANQSGSQMLQNAQLEEAKMAQQARMAALQQQANLASSLRDQDYSEAAKLANSRDAIANFNAQNSQNVQSRNVAAQNNAQQGNLANKQNIANMNTDTLNKQQIHNKGTAQQKFENDMALAGGKAGQYGQQANAAQQQAANTAGMWAGVGQGVGTAASAFGKK